MGQKLQQYLDQYSDVKNTGMVAGSLDPKHAKHIYLVPAGSVLSVADISTIQATLLANMVLNTKSSRWLPLLDIAAIDDKSGDPVTENIALVGNVTIRADFFGAVYRFRRGGLSLHKVRTGLNGMHDAYEAYIIDAAGNMWGEDTVDSTGAPVLAPFSLSNIFSWMKKTDGSNETMYYTAIGFADPDQFNKRMLGIKLGFNFMKVITGVKQISVVFNAQSAAATYKFKLYAGDGAVDLYPAFSALLADAALWAFANAETGTTITATSVTANGVDWTVVLPTTAPPYPAALKYMTATLTTVSALFAVLAGYFEADKILFKRTT